MNQKRSNFDVRIFGAQNHAIQITIRAKNRNFQTTPASALTLKCKKCLVGAGEMARESEMSRKRSNFNVRIFRAQNHAIQITIRAKKQEFSDNARFRAHFKVKEMSRFLILISNKRSNFNVQIFRGQNQAISITQSAIDTNFETIPASALPLKCGKCLSEARKMGRDRKMGRTHPKHHFHQDMKYSLNLLRVNANVEIFII